MSRNKHRNLPDTPAKIKTVIFPKIDVVIPVYGQFPTLANGIEALDNAMNGISYRVFMTDDVSPDLAKVGRDYYSSLKDNSKIAPITYHKNNQGFGKSCNDAASMGSAKYILIHSSDVVLMPDSVKIMYEHIENNPDIGIIAPKLLFFPNQKDPNRPAGKVQSVGIFFDSMGEPFHPFNGWDENHPLVNIVRDVNATTGATFLIRRNVWQQLKGFSLDYGRGTWEDIDISFRTRMSGLKIRILPQAVGYHYTNLSVLGDKEGFPLNHNKDIFKAKFNQIIPYDSWVQSGVFYDD